MCILLDIDEWERITDFGELRGCHDCGAKPGGDLHMAGCDTERCPLCGGQLLSCGCYYKMEEYKPCAEDGKYITMRVEEENKLHRILNEKVGLLPWDGEWPGVKEARLYNLYCYWGPPWVKCSKDHPQAREDLNSVYMKCRWNPEMKHFQLVGELKDRTYEEMIDQLSKELRNFYEAYRRAVRSLGESPQETGEEKEEYHRSI